MGLAILMKGGGGGAISDDITVEAKDVIEGKTVVTHSSDDEIIQGTLPKNRIIEGDGYEGTLPKSWVRSGGGYAGTMTDNGAVSPNELNPGQSYTVPQGYHNGNGVIIAKELNFITATAPRILEGFVGSDKNGNTVVGTIPTATNSGKTLYATESVQSSVIDGGKYVSAPVNIGAISSTYVGSGVTRKSATTITPSTSAVTAVSSGTYTTGNITVAAVNVSLPGASAILTGKSASVTSNGTSLGSVAGTMADYSGASKSANVSYDGTTFTMTIPAGGHYSSTSKLTNNSAVKSVLSFNDGSKTTSGARIEWQYPASGPFNGVRILRKDGKNATFSGANDPSATVVSSGTTGTAKSGAGASKWYYYIDTTATAATYYSYIVYGYIIVNGSYFYSSGSSVITSYRTNNYKCNPKCRDCCDSDCTNCCKSHEVHQEGPSCGQCTCDLYCSCDSRGCNDCGQHWGNECAPDCNCYGTY